MRRRRKDHWDKQYNQTRIKAFGILWKDRSRLVEMLTDYMKDTDIEQLQLSRERLNHLQPHDGQVQTNSLDATYDHYRGTTHSPTGIKNGLG